MTPSAQLVMLGFDRPSLDLGFRRRIERHGVGGVFLYGEALGPPAQVRELTAELQSLAPEGLPLLIAVDQEGAELQAWGPPHQELLPSPRQLGFELEATGDAMEVTVQALGVGRYLAAAGINLDFAPVLDVDTNPENPIIGSRSFSRRPEAVGRAGCAFIDGLHAAGVLACGKHFPGHGDTDLDSHKALPTVSHGIERLEAVELMPFGAAFLRGLEVVMTAHVVYPAWDAEHPATLSRTVLQDVLRRDLAFTGVVVTDDLKMEGVRERHDLIESGVLALEAGSNLLLSATEHERQDELLEGLEAARRDGRLSEARVRESRGRLETLKRDWLLHR